MPQHTTTLIAEVNSSLPRTFDAPTIPLERFTAVVHTSLPLIAVAERRPREIDAVIAEHVAALIYDGDTIQIGVGQRPSAVLSRLGDRRDLGVHSGVVIDGIADLVERGVVTGARKERDIRIAGGGETILEYVDAGLIDEFSIALSPVLFGSGVRLFAGVDGAVWPWTRIRAQPTQRATHLTYAVRDGSRLDLGACPQRSARAAPKVARCVSRARRERWSRRRPRCASVRRLSLVWAH